jgi:hypothetical protein
MNPPEEVYFMVFRPWDFPMSILIMSGWHGPAHSTKKPLRLMEADKNTQIIGFQFIDDPCES